MAGGPTTRAGDRAAAGWSALAEARWRDARQEFTAALADRETPEAHEGLSWAAWWLDDGPTVFLSRESAYRLYGRRGDAFSAARMATWLAIDNLDFRGAHAVAAGWVRRAHRLLDPLDPGPDHGWLAFFDGYLAHGTGNVDVARERAAAAAEIGRRFAVPDLEMLGLALEGAALVAAGELDEGMSRLDEATAAALAGEASIPISGAWACCFLVSACAATLDFERAFDWCTRIQEFAERYGSRYMLAFCRTEYGQVYLWQGRWSDAERLLTSAQEDYSASRPAWRQGPLVTLAELRRRQGRRVEATKLLDAAGPSSASLLCRAAIALDDRNARRAGDLVQRLLRRSPAPRSPSRAPALLLNLRILVARGALEEATQALEGLRSIEAVVRTPPLSAMAALGEGILAAAYGDHERARPVLEDAVDLFEQSGAPFETAGARLELATSLLALGRVDDARREAGVALEALQALGARSEAERARSIGAASSDRGPLHELTAREREVLGLLTEGLTNREIARRLVVSEHTVHRHVTNILRKLDLHSRTAAAALALRSGLLDSAEA
jgi:LuxR family maltose regulon positive regulatory protein